MKTDAQEQFRASLEQCKYPDEQILAIEKEHLNGTTIAISIALVFTLIAACGILYLSMTLFSNLLFKLIVIIGFLHIALLIPEALLLKSKFFQTNLVRTLLGKPLKYKQFSLTQRFSLPRTRRGASGQKPCEPDPPPEIPLRHRRRFRPARRVSPSRQKEPARQAGMRRRPVQAMNL